ncbi:YcxB family protein [Saccharothrix variisporea]|uniref:YcxB-like protein n=1 Tax=Saccharothrix variisporea TaxID=543527 RepID=A0A495XGC2_9PSEU|nr:YcxB family protein [Saccharothrix variisporea]RKT72749.1 YcxB-like protein [Saccharothrix variisporea]
MTSYVHVPYDETLLRRTIEYMLRPHLKRLRPAGLAMAGGAVIMAVTGVWPLYLWAPVIVLGLFFTFAMKPYLIGNSVKQQWAGIKADFRLDADEEWVSFSYPAFQTRIRWEAMEKVVETPEAWLLVLGRIQATAVPKSAMTPEQLAEFTALLARRRPPVPA